MRSTSNLLDEFVREDSAKYSVIHAYSSPLGFTQLLLVLAGDYLFFCSSLLAVAASLNIGVRSNFLPRIQFSRH